MALIAGLGAAAPATVTFADDLAPAVGDTVNLYGGPGTLEGKFERADGEADPQGWVTVDESGAHVGNFGQLWKGLGEVDVDQDNPSPQWAFIDDGLVVPGCGPTYCKDGMYCYGPQEMVTNITGGAGNGVAGIDCAVVSPLIALHEENGWPVLSLDAYLHNGQFPFADWLLTAYFLDATADPSGQTGWNGYWDTFLYGAEVGHYVRLTIPFTPDIMPEGMLWARIRLVVYQPSVFVNSYGTPAPYFDNVRLQWVRGSAAAADLPTAPIAATAVPNPFNPSVTIRWSAPAGSRATVRVHDLAGRLVADLFGGANPGSGGEVVWNGRDASGRAVAAGVYLCRITVDADVRVLKLTLAR
jgi:hypothetical protein